ncbi:MAG TPA: amidohydrolase family protein, partial [Anaerovoracaceae bacterium]|nr:amidohydrolase family protein [Anaerovoracaceae bacterium]
TGFCSATAFIDNDHFRELEETNELTMRANLSIRMDADDPNSSLDELIALDEYFEGSNLIEVSTAKFFIDGVVEGVTAYLLEPYTPEAGMGDNYVSEPMWDYDVYEDAMKKVVEAGYQIHVHSIGDAATNMTLDALEAAQKDGGEGDYRNVITHVQLIGKDDFARFGQLNLIAAIQPFWSLKEPDWYDTVDELVLGPERAWNEYPFGSLKRGGAVITSSGDFPVSPINNPFWAIEAGATRNLNNAEYYGIDDINDMDDPTWLLNPDERLTVKDMVEAYTINGAYQMFREDKIGSLAVGKEADFIIIDKDIMNLDPIDIDSIKVLATYLGGNAVYEGN